MEFKKINRSAFLNFVLAKYERLVGEVKPRSLPYFMLIDPSSICQLRCPFCPTGVENAAKAAGSPIHLRERVRISPELYDDLLQELGETLFQLRLYNWGGTASP